MNRARQWARGWISAVAGRFKALREARRGAVAVMFALSLIPMILASGAAVDFARIGMLKRSLQSVVDGAALSGASALCLSGASTSAVTVATDYFNKGAASLTTTATVGSPTVTIPSAIEVTVAATATLQYSLMAVIGSGLTVSVTASAEGPSYQLQVTKTGGFTSSAYDSDSVYFYTVASNGTLPTTTGSMKLIFTNNPSVDPNYVMDNAAPKSISIGANDSVGFALVNITGGITGYPSNGYGARQGSVHYFYSSATVPSVTAYSSQGTFTTGQMVTTGFWPHQNTGCRKTTITTSVASYVSTENDSCNAHPCTAMNGSVVLENNLLVAGSCSTQSAATRTCLQLYNAPLSFSWNDMGGGSDDYDYNDADYTVTCAPSATSATQPNSVILVQ
jgi:Flp pilus assembly protein TadG